MGPSRRAAREPDDTGRMLAALVADPGVDGVGRLPLRPLLVPFPDLGGALDGVPVTSPWWRPLDGEWDLRMVDSPSSVTAELVAGDGDGWQQVNVPCAWTTPGLRDDGPLLAPHYTNVVMPFDADPPTVPEDNPVGIHRRRVTVPLDWRGRRTVLRVGGAESFLGVWVDGSFVGAGTDSRLPNEFDLTGYVRPGRTSTIVLVVVRWSAATWLEDQDQWWHGGIQRSVTLYSTATSRLADMATVPGWNGAVGTLDLYLRVEGPAAREPGWTVRFRVLRNGRNGQPARTRPLVDHRVDLPVWDASSEVAQLLSGMFVRPGEIEEQIEVPGVAPWSHEDPVRHRIVVELSDPAGSVVETVARWTGFRSVEVAGNELRINGAAVLLHGVNLHEHDPQRGRAVTESLTRRDLELMKAHNLNAVRAAHYPHDEHLAELCDELGLYLVDEANVESHARQVSLCHDPRFLASIVNRVDRMVRRDRSHPSIIMWSLGNEAGDGPAQAAAAASVRRVDPTRPLHYEGPLMHDLYAPAPVTDVVCPMYAPIEEIVAWARSGRDHRRPLILCEYSHAMGNSNGSLSDYWEAFETHHGLQGGFIWEWVEHGLTDPGAGSGPGGRTSWRYGGDFGDHPNDTNFVCDGLVAADRTPRPALREVHWVGRPASVALAPDGGLVVHNRRWFSTIDDLEARWQLTSDGVEVSSGRLEVPDVSPRSSVTVPLPVERPEHDGSEWYLTVRWRQRRATAWAAKGHEVGHDQLPVATDGAVGPTSPRAWSSTVTVEDLAWRPTMFRALTDNDGLRQGWMRGHLGQLARWIDRLGLDREEWYVDERSTVTVRGRDALVERGRLVVPGASDPLTVERVLAPAAEGPVHVEVRLVLPAVLEDPPRLGTVWELDPGLATVEWFGDGPHECYPDRRAAALVGRWSAAIDDLYVDHVVPQEHGHRTGVRWLALRPEDAADGLLVVVDPGVGAGTVGMSVRRFDDATLWSATHTDELPAPQGTFLSLDVAHRGLGTASCGPDALEQYRIGSGPHRFAVWMATLPSGADPGRLSRALTRRR